MLSNKLEMGGGEGGKGPFGSGAFPDDVTF